MGSTLQPLAQLQTLLGAMVWLLVMPKGATDAGCGNARLAIPRLDIPIAWVVCWATAIAAQHRVQNTIAMRLHILLIKVEVRAVTMGHS